VRTPERGSHSSGTMLAHRLAQPTRMTGLETGCSPRFRVNPCHPYSVLLPVGFTMPSLSPATRWALTPPFHPYPANSAAPKRAVQQAGRYPFCGTFPGVAPAGRYPAPCFRGARTFLTLPPFGIGKARLPGQLASGEIVEMDQECQKKAQRRFTSGNSPQNPTHRHHPESCRGRGVRHRDGRSRRSFSPPHRSRRTERQLVQNRPSRLRGSRSA
jgi:hypothetical protein